MTSLQTDRMLTNGDLEDLDAYALREHTCAWLIANTDNWADPYVDGLLDRLHRMTGMSVNGIRTDIAADLELWHEENPTPAERWARLWRQLGQHDDERDAALEDCIEFLTCAGFGPDDEEVSAAMQIGYTLGARNALERDAEIRRHQGAAR
jgi:hypothetical protein